MVGENCLCGLYVHPNAVSTTHTDGHFICSGNYLTVQFYGEQRTFKAIQTSCSSDQPAPTDISLQFSGSLLDSSILGGMSELSLNNTPFKHARRVAPDFSTPKDDGSIAIPGIDGGMELGTGGVASSLLEPEQDPVYLSSLTKYHSLTEDQSSSVVEGPVSPVCAPSEVLVYRITSRTKIQFVDSQSEKGKKDKVYAAFLSPGFILDPYLVLFLRFPSPVWEDCRDRPSCSENWFSTPWRHLRQYAPKVDKQ